MKSFTTLIDPYIIASMKSNEVRKKYLEFFKNKGHKIIPSSSLVPENDPTTLFISAGMQPLVPYLLGELHPEGKRLVDAQKCLRTDDIEEVGDEIHHTFFEMLGNWSLGEYFKQEAITWSFEFLTSKEWLNIPINKIAISVFAGDSDAPFDDESYKLWKELGIAEERIAKLPKKNNWWGPAGQTGPCGPDTEMFYWAPSSEPPKHFDPEDLNWVEIWNDVFMQYFKKESGNFELLKQKNVDTGMGLERTIAVLQGLTDNYKTDLFLPIIQKLEEQTGKSYEENKREFRVIADHIKAATFLIKDGVIPSNKQQGYVLRRLIRRSAIKINSLKPNSMDILPKLVDPIIDIYAGTEYFQTGDWDNIRLIIAEELIKFEGSLNKGLREIAKIEKIDGKLAFDLYQSFGFPLEITTEIFQEKGQQINKKEFEEEFKKHQELSRTTSAGAFKGGLADSSEKTTRLHTANHLLQAALRIVLGKHVRQRGSNITSERLRFDFPHPQKLTEEELKKVEDLVNAKIAEDLKVWFDIEDKTEAIKKGALTNYGENYPEKSKIYKIADSAGQIFSMEFCGGPHVTHTNLIGKFKILKQESLGAGLRRIYATLLPSYNNPQHNQ